MSMNPARLYEELGRAVAAKNEARQALHDIPYDQDDERQAALLEAIRTAQRVQMLGEAVRLHEEGMDPLQAKIVASESVKDAELVGVRGLFVERGEELIDQQGLPLSAIKQLARTEPPERGHK